MRRFFVSKIFLLLAVVVFGFLSFSVSKKFLEEKEINAEIRAAEDEIARLEAKNTELSDLFDYLNTDAFLEQEAREKFNLQRAGEEVMVVPGNGETPGKGAKVAVADAGSERQSNPTKWWNYFFSQ